jgi:hypothetical protein
MISSSFLDARKAQGFGEILSGEMFAKLARNARLL